MPAHSLALHHVTLNVRRRDNGRRLGMLRVLKDCNLEITAGEAVAVVGPARCGKSAVLDLLAGFGHPARGRVLVDGTKVTGHHPSRGFVVPEYTLFPWRTVFSNVAFALDWRLTDSVRHRLALEALDWVGLGDAALAVPEELSLADRRRVALARALAQQPGALLLDEPYAGLAPAERRRLSADLARIRRLTGATLVVATNDLPEAVRVAERVAVLSPLPANVAAVVDVAANPSGALGSVWTVLGAAESLAA